MPNDASFQTAVDRICVQDSRYTRDAYYFVVEGLDYTVKELGRQNAGHGRHVSGSELAYGLHDYALREFGALAFAILGAWGVHTTHDFGQVVFNLVKAGRLGKTEQDKASDFDGIYDFQTEFLTPFLPASPRGRAKLLRELKAI